MAIKNENAPEIKRATLEMLKSQQRFVSPIKHGIIYSIVPQKDEEGEFLLTEEEFINDEGKPVIYTGIHLKSENSGKEIVVSVKAFVCRDFDDYKSEAENSDFVTRTTNAAISAEASAEEIWDFFLSHKDAKFKGVQTSYRKQGKEFYSKMPSLILA